VEKKKKGSLLLSFMIRKSNVGEFVQTKPMHLSGEKTSKDPMRLEGLHGFVRLEGWTLKGKRGLTFIGGTFLSTV